MASRSTAGGRHAHLATRGLVKTFGRARVLREVDFDLRAGEIHALVGQNGAGKSTLARILGGSLRPDGGSILLDGAPCRFTGPRDAERHGIVTVPQEGNLIPDLTVAENITLGREPRRGPFIRRLEQDARASRALARIGARIDPRRLLATLDVAARQLTAIARALDAAPAFLILDEPTASLPPTEASAVLDAARALRAEGLGIVVISHFLDQVLGVADRITVLRDGSRTGSLDAAGLTRADLISAMVGRKVEARPAPAADAGRPPGPARLEARSIARRGHLEPMDVTIGRGEAVGAAGLLGAGRTELLRLLAGADRADEGQVLLDGSPVRLRTPRDAIARGIVLAPEDRRAAGIAADLTVFENIALALLGRRGLLGPLDRNRLAVRVIALCEAVALPVVFLRSPAGTLSGGNQQKVILARCLALEPAILLADDPARGVDVAARFEIEAVLAEAVRRGASLLLTSSELDEILRLCTRAILLRDRRKIGELHGGALTESGVLEGLAAPEPSQ